MQAPNSPIHQFNSPILIERRIWFDHDDLLTDQLVADRQLDQITARRNRGSSKASAPAATARCGGGWGSGATSTRAFVWNCRRGWLLRRWLRRRWLLRRWRLCLRRALRWSYRRATRAYLPSSSPTATAGAQIPLDAIEPGVPGAHKCANLAAGDVTDGDAHVGSRSAFQPVADRRSLCGVLSAEELRALEEDGLLYVRDPGDRWPDIEQDSIGRCRWVRQLLQRGDVVHDVDAAAVRAENEVVITRMHEHIIDSYCGQAVHEPLPFASAIE